MPQLTGQVAQAVGVTPQTVRSWSARFSDWLSPEASTPGQTRYFSDDDLITLKAVAHYRSLNLSYADIADRLREGDHLTLSLEEEEPPPPAPMVTMSQVEMLLQPLAAAADEWRSIAQTLREENTQLRQELAQARLPWWRRLLGR